VKLGQQVHQGLPVARIHARNLIDFEMAVAMFDQALKIDPINPH